MLTLTKITLIAGVVYPVGTPESDLDGVTPGELRSLTETGVLVEPPEPGSVQTINPSLTEASNLASFGVTKRLVDIMAENDPPLLTKADVIAYLVDHENLVPVNGIGAKSSEIILRLLGLA